MSSHHFVKEGQEPALIVLGWPKEGLNLLGEFLEWSPNLIIHCKLISHFTACSVKFDGLILDESNPNDVREFLPVELYPIEKGIHQFEFSEIDVVLGHKSDLTQSWSDFEDHPGRIYWFVDNKKYYKLEGTVFEKWFLKDERVELWLDSNVDLQTHGFVKDLAGITIDGHYILEVVETGLVHIESLEGTLDLVMLGETIF